MTLDLMIGVYLRGEVAVYLGSASARDNQNLSSGFANAPDMTLSANDTALAALDGQRLEITSTCEGELLSVQQQQDAPRQTEVWAISSDRSSALYSGTCLGCIPDLSTPPESITWTGATASSDPTTFPDNLGAFRSVSSVDLRRKSPCSLTWDQLVVLNARTGYIADFVRFGNEMVSTFSGATSIPPTGRTCDGSMTAYTVDLYVNLADLSDYGTRNFKVGATTPLCGA